MPPNAEFTFQSADPKECIFARMWVKDSVEVFLNGQSMSDTRKLRDGTYPTTTSPGGTYANNPQKRKVYLTMCGHPSGSAVYMLRVMETIQVTMQVEMTFSEFFSEQTVEEGDPGFVKGPGSEELYQVRCVRCTAV